ncbi:3-deoxy-D-manno-octulosonic acid transferase [Thiohalorhabdus sp.]|uniref:3-deoxy-D-manno-octulosonic acid transferase n=1 Tax=Thiohalorhabdus sp. TaxID=3094134 RepID=UPI002FC29F0B
MTPAFSQSLMPTLCQTLYLGLARLVGWTGHWHAKGDCRDARGRVTARGQAPRLWLHAGTRAGLDTAGPLAQAWQVRHPGAGVIITVRTQAALVEAEALLGDEALVTYLPQDTPAAARRFLASAAPDIALCLGPAPWPALSRALDQGEIPWLWLITRILPAPWRWLDRLPCLFRPALDRAETLLVGHDDDSEALLARDVAEERIRVTGSPLLDHDPPPERKAARRLRSALGGRPILFFEGTEPGEEELLTGVCRHLPAPFERWLMVLAPGDPARAPALAQRLARFQLGLAVASHGEALTPSTHIYLLDDPEQRGPLLAAADAVVLGGTWVQGHKGADPRAAAAAGRGILYGPYLQRHREAVRVLDTAGNARQAANVNNLLAALRQWLQHPGEAEAAGRRGREAVAPHQGAYQRVLAGLERQLNQ